MFLQSLTKQKMKWSGVLFFLILLMPLSVFSSDKPGGGTEDLDFEIQNQTLLSVNESGYAISEMSSNRGNPYYPAENAKDGDLETIWSDYLLNLVPGSYLKVDFGEEIVVTKVHIINHVDSNAGMESFDLEYYSSSGWETIGTYETGSEEDGTVIVIDVPEVETQMLRITDFSHFTGKNCVSIKEFQVNVPAIDASRSDSGSLPEYVNDTDKETVWFLCDTIDEDDYLEVDLGKVVLLNGVSLINVVDDDTGLASFEIQYYDGVKYQSLGTYTTQEEDGEAIEIKTSKIKTQFVRLTGFVPADNKTCIGISEFLVNSPVISSNEADDDDYRPFYAGDEDEGTYWKSCVSDDDIEGFLQIDLGNTLSVSRCEIVSDYPESGNNGMLQFDIEYLDGGDWVTIDTYYGATKHQDFFNIRFDEVIEARHFRITNFVQGSDRTCVGVVEVSFFTPDRMYYSLDDVGEDLAPVIEDMVELTTTEDDDTDGRIIVISGENFVEGTSGGNNTVTFKNDESSFDVIDDSATTTKMNVTVPSDTPEGFYDVTVTNINGVSNTYVFELTETDDKDPGGGIPGLDTNVGTFGVCFISASAEGHLTGFFGFVLFLLTSALVLVSFCYEKKWFSGK